MTWLKTVWSEFLGLFIDDAAFAIAILAWLAACWLLLPRLSLPAILPPTILFTGLVLILVESAMRRARS